MEKLKTLTVKPSMKARMKQIEADVKNVIAKVNQVSQKEFRRIMKEIREDAKVLREELRESGLTAEYKGRMSKKLNDVTLLAEK